MRRLYWACLFLILLALASGCSQPAATPAITPASQNLVTLTPAVTAPPVQAEKHLNFTVTSSESMVNVTYNGGPDAADLQSLYIRVDTRTGTYNDRTIVNPTIGSTYVFTYRGVSDASRVNIIGTFSNGYQQTVLLYTL